MISPAVTPLVNPSAASADPGTSIAAVVAVVASPARWRVILPTNRDSMRNRGRVQAGWSLTARGFR